MKVFDVESIGDGSATKFVSFSNTHAPFDATTSHPHGKSVSIMITPGSLSVLSGGLATKFPSPNDQCFIQHSSLLEIFQQTSNRFVRISRMPIMVLLQISMSIPILVIMSTT
jgi:hypothetical protein